MIQKLVYVVLLFSTTTCFSQELSATLSAKKIQIGIPLKLTYSAKSVQNAEIEFISRKKSILAQRLDENLQSKDTVEFEILSDFSDTLSKYEETKTWIGQYTVTVWDSGFYSIPGPEITIDDVTYQFESLRLYSSYTPKIDSLDLYDIQESYIEIPENSTSTLNFIAKNWWWMLAIIVLLFGFIVYRFLKNRNRFDSEKTILLSLEERTLNAIDALEKRKLWEEDRLKEHFVQLSYILRSYLTERYSISLLEKTTHEARLLLEEIALNKSTISSIISVLSEADMVKFAKSKPEVNSILLVSRMARVIVKETRPIESENHAE